MTRDFGNFSQWSSIYRVTFRIYLTLPYPQSKRKIYAGEALRVGGWWKQVIYSFLPSTRRRRRSSKNISDDKSSHRPMNMIDMAFSVSIQSSFVILRDMFRVTIGKRASNWSMKRILHLIPALAIKILVLNGSWGCIFHGALFTTFTQTNMIFSTTAIWRADENVR